MPPMTPYHLTELITISSVYLIVYNSRKRQKNMFVKHAYKKNENVLTGHHAPTCWLVSEVIRTWVPYHLLTSDVYSVNKHPRVIVWQHFRYIKWKRASLEDRRPILSHWQDNWKICAEKYRPVLVRGAMLVLQDAWTHMCCMVISHISRVYFIPCFTEMYNNAAAYAVWRHWHQLEKSISVFTTWAWFPNN